MLVKSLSRLAIQGGPPVRHGPIPPWPFYDEDEVAAVARVLQSGRVNQWTGLLVREFEEKFGYLCQGHHAVAVANGSVALEAALRGLGVGPGDEVIVPARSFVASASCVSLVGARPVFADVELDTQVVSAATIAPLIGPATRAVIVVHLHGRPCDMPSIMELAEDRGVLVIEDCAQSLGAKVEGRYTGSFGHASAFSFCQDKIVTTGGEGGMVTTPDQTVCERVWSWKDHGKVRTLAQAPPSSSGYRWVHDSIGTNGRLTEMQAAIGLRQLDKLDRWLTARASNAERLSAGLSAFPCVRIAGVPPAHSHAYYRLEFSIDPKHLRAGWSRDAILAALMAEGIAASVGTCPEIYREGAFANEQRYPSLPNAKRLGEEALVLLVHPTLTEQYLAECEQAIDKVFTAAC